MPRPVPAAPGSRFPSGHAPALPIGVFRLANPRLRQPPVGCCSPNLPSKGSLPNSPLLSLTHRATVPRLTCATPTLAHWLGLVGCDPPDVVRTVVRRRQFFVGALQAVSATTTHLLSASSLRPPHVDKSSTFWFHHGHPSVAPRPPLHWPAPDPPDWTAPLFLPIRHSFFSLSLPLPSSSFNRHFFGPVLSSTISGRAISLVIRLFKPHPRRRDKPVRRQPCPPIDVDQRTTARLH